MLGTIDILLQDLAEGFSYPLAGVDNDANGIREEDTLAMLSTILRGTHRVAQLDATMVSTIRTDFAYNRNAADNDLRAEGSNCSLLGIAGYPCKLTDILRQPGLVEGGDQLANLLLDFFGGLTTTSEPSTFGFINNYIDALANAFASDLPPEIPSSLVSGLKNDLHLSAGNYRSWGGSSGAPNRLGAAGNVDYNLDAETNYTEYQAAGTNRENWLTRCSMIPPIHVTVNPVGGSFLTGDELNLTVTFAGGEGPFSFQWQRAEDYPTLVTIPGATSQTLAFPYLTLAYDNWKPWLRLSDPITVWNAGGTPGAIEGTGFGGRTSRFSNPEISVGFRAWGVRPNGQPTGAYRFPGESLQTTFGVWGGNEVPTYQWYRGAIGSGTAIAGQTTRTMSLTNLQTTDEGPYYCIATNAGVPLTSNQFTLYVRPHMSITQQPVGGNYGTSQSHTFQVTIADGHPPLSYQWYRANIGTPPGTGGSAVGPNSATYTLDPLSAGQQGQYYCVVRDQSGESITTNTVTLRILAILEHPKPVDVKPAFPALFEVLVAEGSGLPFPAPNTYTYQWYVSYEEPVGTPVREALAGATGTMLVIPSALPGNPSTGGHEGDYTVVVTDAAGSTVESARARLNIAADPIEFMVQPQGARKYVGESHAMLVVATGGTGNTFTYQWFKDGILLTNKTSFVLTLDPLQITDSGVYYCEVGEMGVRPDLLPCAYSANAIVEVAAPLQVTGDLGEFNLYAGEPFTATSTYAGGLGVQRFRWYKGATLLPSETAGALTIPAVSLADTGKYRCDVLDDRNVALSTTFAWLNVYSPLAISAQPVGASLLEGDSHNLEVAVNAATGIGELHYQWTKDGMPVGPDSPILALSNVTEEDSAVYACEITDVEGRLPGGILVSDNATIDVDVPFQIPALGNPVSASVYRGDEHIFQTFTRGAEGTVAYQWFFEGAAIPGANSSAFTIPNCDTVDAGLYSVSVTDNLGTPADPLDDITLTSAQAQLSIVSPMAITQQPISQVVPRGDNATFSVVVEGGIGTLAYQWQRNGQNIAGATEGALTLLSVIEVNEATYSCVIADERQTVTSEGATLALEVGAPVAGAAGLAAMAALLALAGALKGRRRS